MLMVRKVGVCVICLFIPCVCFAGLTGVIRGKVRLPSGDGVPQAEVFLKESKRMVTTTDSGFFVFVGVSPGVYTVGIHKEDVGTTVVRNVVVHVDLAARIFVTFDSGKANVRHYFRNMLLEPGTMRYMSGNRLRYLPIGISAQGIRTLSSIVEIDRYF